VDYLYQRAKVLFLIPPSHPFAASSKWSHLVSLVFLVLVRLILSLAVKHRFINYEGANREVKKAVEAYWAGKISADDLTRAAAEVKKTSWTSVKSRGVDYIPR
jgi:hypothetical protein